MPGVTWLAGFAGSVSPQVTEQGSELVSHALSLNDHQDDCLPCDLMTVHYGTKPGHFETSKIHFPTSEGVSEVSK